MKRRTNRRLSLAAYQAEQLARDSGVAFGDRETSDGLLHSRPLPDAPRGRFQRQDTSGFPPHKRTLRRGRSAYVLMASGARNKFVFSPPNQCRDGYAVVCTLGVGDTPGSRLKRPEWIPFIAPLRLEQVLRKVLPVLPVGRHHPWRLAAACGRHVRLE
jgi:hypothetical protein